VGSGEVLHDTRRSHTDRDVLALFRWIDMHVPPDRELHVSFWHLHFTPTSSSWLNLVECWFSVLSRKASTKRPIHLRRRTRNPDRLLGLPLGR